MEIFFLTSQDVLHLQADLIAQYGGDAGIRDMKLLLSAIAQPQSGIQGQYLNSDLFEMAAAYLFHLVNNHPFVDGNKRIGAACAIIFLDMNGIEIKADEESLVEITLATARGEATKTEIVEYFRINQVP